MMNGTRSSRARVRFAAVSLLLFVTSCSSEPEALLTEVTTTDTAIADTSTSTTTTPTETASSDSEALPDCSQDKADAVLEPMSLSEQLQYLPEIAGAANRLFFVNFALMQRDLGLSIPPADCTEAVDDYAHAMLGGFLPVRDRGFTLADPSEVIASQLDSYGFSFLDLALDIEGGTVTAPLRVQTPIRSQAATQEAVEGDPEWAQDLIVTEIDGGALYHWGGYLIESRERTGARTDGQGGALAVVANTAIRSYRLELVSDSIDAATNQTGLGSNKSFVQVAEVLEGFEVHNGAVGQPLAKGQGVNIRIGPDQDMDEALAALDSYPTLPGYEVLGLGWTSQTTTGPGVITMVFLTTSEAAAEETVLAMQKRVTLYIPTYNMKWPEILTFRQANVEGNIAILQFDATHGFSVRDLLDDALVTFD